MTAKELYNSALEKRLGQKGAEIIKWLNEQTVDEDFYEQPVNPYQQDKLLIVHAVNMLGMMDKMSKSLFSKKDESGEWKYEPRYSAEEIAMVALLHVFGNIGKYKKEKRNKKIDGSWKEVETWVYNEEQKIYGTDGENALVRVNGLIYAPSDVQAAIMHCHERTDPQAQGMYPRLYKDNMLVLLAQLADKAETFID